MSRSGRWGFMSTAIKTNPTSQSCHTHTAVRAIRRIGFVSSISWLLVSAACSGATSTAGVASQDDAGQGEGGVAAGGDASATGDAGPLLVTGGGDAGHVKDAAAPPGCDLSKDPKDSAPCVVDSVGVFVDGMSGADSNDGTRAHPLAHIQAALAKGSGRVYVCAGTYAEHVKITAGVGVFGGWKCSDFSYDAASIVSIAPTDAGYAVEIADVADGVILEDLTMTAIAGTADAPSSIAVFAHGSASVTMKRGGAVAGDGFAGTSSTVGANYVDAQAPNGNAGTFASNVAVAGLAPTCACANGVNSAAGRGYGVPADAVSGRNATAGGPAIVGVSGGTAGATGSACGAGGTGQAGANGVQGSDGATPTSAGALTAQGWGARPGGPGTGGGPAQGGGGGSGFNGTVSSGAGGGSGACGGCGGAPATGTTGGGGSIALLSFESAVTLIASSLSTGAGGDGGNGAAGQAGEAGGTGGGGALGVACSGGNGGNGGNGGGSAGGAGGVSVGLLYLAKTVKAPSVDAVTMSAITTGTAGNRGSGGVAGKDGVAIPAQKIEDASGI